MSRIYSKITQLSHKRITHNFERERGKRFFIARVAKHFFFQILGVMPLHRRYIQRRRQIIADRVKHQLDPFIFECATAENRHDSTRDNTFAKGWYQFFKTNLFAFQKARHELFVLLHNHFNQSAAIFFGLVLHICGHVGFLNLFSRFFSKNVCFLPQQIYHALETALHADRQLERIRLFRQSLVNGGDIFIKIRAGAIQFVDKTNARHVVFVRIAPVGFRLRFHARHAVKHHDRAIKNAQ